MSEATNPSPEEQAITVEEYRQQWRARAFDAASRCHIMVASMNLWPICACDPFVEACERLHKAEVALRQIAKHRLRGRKTQGALLAEEALR